MKKITTIVLSGTMALFLSACGSSGGSSSSTPVAPVDPMTERDAITIFYHVPAEICEDAEFQNQVITGVRNKGYDIYNELFRVESLDVNCATYGRTNDSLVSSGCITDDMALVDSRFLEYKESCVLGFDLDLLDATTDLSIIKGNMALEMSYSMDAVEYQ